MIKRVNRGRNHWYIDEDTGQKIPGVTTITDALAKDALINWAATSTAEYAVNKWDELAALPPADRLKRLNKARYEEKDKASNRGTQVHALGEQLVHGDRVAVPDELAGHVESYIAFLDEFDVQPVLVERTIHSAQHGYCGTFDLIADLLDPDDPEPDPAKRRRHRWLLDLKTSRSGIFGETALQLAGYRYGDVWIDEDEHAEHQMIEVERTGGVHIRPDGYDLIPVEAGPLQHRQFLYCMQMHLFLGDKSALIGEPVLSPYTTTYRLVRDEEAAA